MATIHPFASKRTRTTETAAVLLAECIRERDLVRAETLLGELVTSHVEPLAMRVVSSRMRRHSSAHRIHVEDLTSEAVVSFLVYVEDLRHGRVAPVANFEAFVATLAARACNSYFRRAHPMFHGLRNKLRYLLERYPEMARWKDQETGVWICGLADWPAQGRPARPIAGHVDEMEGLEKCLAPQHPADQLLCIFQRIGAPVPFNDLALLMARVWNVQEAEVDSEQSRELADSSHPADVTLGQKQWLAILWKRIQQLSRNQRVALLLNLKGPDGTCGAGLLVTTGVASIRQIALAVELPAAEFAHIWRRLPLNDLEVASLLRLTRQQVINLRKCARAKLVRHNDR